MDAPPAVAFAILAVLGGACGAPVSLWISDAPPDVVAGIQGMLVQQLPRGRILEVLGRSELRLLADEPAGYSLVLVDPVRGGRHAGEAVQWILGRRTGTPSPAVLLGPGGGLGECPGPLLMLRTSQDEASAIRGWLLANAGPDPKLLAFLGGIGTVPHPVDFGALGGLVGLPPAAPLWRPRTLTSFAVVRGLLAGRALLREVLQETAGGAIVRPALADYVDIHGLFARAAAALPADPGDPLLAAMVLRVNFHMSCFHISVTGDLPGGGRIDPEESVGSRASRDALRKGSAITLRELADLGEPRSALFRSLISRLSDQGTSLRLEDIGWRGNSPPLRASGLGHQRLSSMLITWSPKQARTRFDGLRRQGLIDAVRDPPGNGPWVFRLPEAIRGLPGEFDDLPDPRMLERNLKDVGPTD